MAKSRDPYDLALDDAQRAYLATWLNTEIDTALAVRTMSEADVEYAFVRFSEGVYEAVL